MKIGIAGYSNTGKTTIFNALTKGTIETAAYASASAEPHIGMVKVPDKRIEELTRVHKPKKVTYEDVQYIDIAGIAMGSAKDEKTVKVLSHIRDVDAIIQVARGFSDENIVHVADTIDPISDAKNFELELILRDLELVENRLERIEHSIKRAATADKEVLNKEREVLTKCLAALEEESPLRQFEFDEDEIKVLNTYQFLSRSPEIVVVNADEDDLNSEKLENVESELIKYYEGKNTAVTSICAKIEEEIAQLSDEEAALFLEDLQIKEPALDKLIHLSYKLLGLMPFFTVGVDEVRAWTIKKNTTAAKAAGKIHSDIERGFIRAEVISYDDYMSVDYNMVKAKEKGLVRLEGKSYIMQDGDIVNFRFNV
ncbi:redox-regulated ATPase YchF [Thermodesulfobacteriota bacterium]